LKAPVHGAVRAPWGPGPVPPQDRGEHPAQHPRVDCLGLGRRGLAGTPMVVAL
jgi:hypothetical protein